MTTSKAVLHKGDEGAFRALMQSPAVRSATAAVADAVLANLRASWPEGDEVSSMEGVPVFERASYEMADGRPAEWVKVNHAKAVMHEARSGFITMSVAAAGGKISRR